MQVQLLNLSDMNHTKYTPMHSLYTYFPQRTNSQY